jgi:hypothetical protein
MMGAGVTTVVVVGVDVGLGLPPTITAEFVVALRTGAPKTLLASGDETSAFNLVVSFDKVDFGAVSSLAVVTAY